MSNNFRNFEVFYDCRCGKKNTNNTTIGNPAIVNFTQNSITYNVGQEFITQIISNTPESINSTSDNVLLNSGSSVVNFFDSSVLESGYTKRIFIRNASGNAVTLNTVGSDTFQNGTTSFVIPPNSTLNIEMMNQDGIWHLEINAKYYGGIWVENNPEGFINVPIDNNFVTVLTGFENSSSNKNIDVATPTSNIINILYNGTYLINITASLFVNSVGVPGNDLSVEVITNGIIRNESIHTAVIVPLTPIEVPLSVNGILYLEAGNSLSFRIRSPSTTAQLKITDANFSVQMIDPLATS